MNREYFECARDCCRRGGWWKFLAVVFFAAFVFSAISALMLKIKNDEYRDALIDVSERFPTAPEQEEELAQVRKREWSRAHAPANRMTDEERMEENRIDIEE